MRWDDDANDGLYRRTAAAINMAFPPGGEFSRTPVTWTDVAGIQHARDNVDVNLAVDVSAFYIAVDREHRKVVAFVEWVRSYGARLNADDRSNGSGPGPTEKSPTAGIGNIPVGVAGGAASGPR